MKITDSKKSSSYNITEDYTFKKLAKLKAPDKVAKTKLIVAPVCIAETANTVPIFTNVELATNPANTLDQTYIRVSARSASKALTRNFTSPLSTLYNS